jgi:hypothetical protein
MENGVSVRLRGLFADLKVILRLVGRFTEMALEPLFPERSSTRWLDV